MEEYYCDGCHQLEGHCICDELEAEREEMYGPVCHHCNGDSENGYEHCEFAFDPVYEAGPGSDEPGSFGCPRLTGTF